MKKIITLLITLTMVLTMTVPTFAADDVAGDADAVEPAELSAAQVKVLKPSGVKAVSYSYTKIKVSWNKIEGVDGYKVYRATSKSGKYTVSKTTTSADTLSYINTGRTTGKTYFYKVRGYKKIGKTTYYTKYSAVTSTYARPNKVSITKVTLGGSDKDRYNRTPKTSWKAVTGATGYEVYRSRVDKESWMKLISTTKTYYTDTSKSFYFIRNYKYKVRAYRTVNGKKVYGYFSTPKEFKPDWTMEELMPELIAYGESIQGRRMQYNPMTEEYEPYNGPRGQYFTMTHSIGSIRDASTLSGYKSVSWGDTEAMKNPTFEAATPENSSWTAGNARYIDPYWSKETVVKELKKLIKGKLESEMRANPLWWEIGTPDEPDWWSGTDEFTLYYRHENFGLENDRGYHFYVMH